MNLPNTIILGLGFQTGVGKTSIAHYLVNEYGFVRMSIAQKLKEIAGNLFSQEIDAKFKSQIVLNSTGREFLQKLAEFLRAECGPDFFVCNMNLRTHNIRHRRIVVDDVRFAEEVRYLQRIGGKCFKITRPNHMHFADDPELKWSGKDAKWNSVVRNVDIPFAGDLIMRIIAGEEQENIDDHDEIYQPRHFTASAIVPVEH